ncbi:MAG: helix-turn-helix transcriptional regulator [Pseudomonadota bacterium]
MGQDLIIDLSNVVEALQEERKAQGVSLRKLEELTGIPKSSLSYALSKNGKLDLSDFLRICLAMDIDPKDLLTVDQVISVEPDLEIANKDQRREAQALQRFLRQSLDGRTKSGFRPTFDEMLIWHRKNGGRMTDMDRISPFVCSYYAPDKAFPELKSAYIGHLCLTAESLKTYDSARVERYIASLDEESREEITFSYVQTTEGPACQLFDRKLVVDFPGCGPRFQLEYATLLMRLTGENGSTFITNFSLLLDSKLLDPPEPEAQDSKRSTPISVRTPREKSRKETLSSSDS